MLSSFHLIFEWPKQGHKKGGRYTPQEPWEQGVEVEVSLGEKGIPDDNIEQFARIIAGEIQNYYNLETNRKKFEKWLVERSKKIK